MSADCLGAKVTCLCVYLSDQFRPRGPNLHSIRDLLATIPTIFFASTSGTRRIQVQWQRGSGIVIRCFWVFCCATWICRELGVKLLSKDKALNDDAQWDQRQSVRILEKLWDCVEGGGGVKGRIWFKLRELLYRGSFVGN